MTDELSIDGIECFAHHGVFDHERRDGQVFKIDLVLGVDTRSAAASDDLADTVDYGGLVDRVVAAVESDPVDLIETLAQRIADGCLAHPGVQVVEIVVHKPQAPVGVPASDVAIRILRRRMA